MQTFLTILAKWQKNSITSHRCTSHSVLNLPNAVVLLCCRSSCYTVVVLQEMQAWCSVSIECRCCGVYRYQERERESERWICSIDWGLMGGGIIDKTGNQRCRFVEEVSWKQCRHCQLTQIPTRGPQGLNAKQPIRLVHLHRWVTVSHSKSHPAAGKRLCNTPTTWPFRKWALH